VLRLLRPPLPPPDKSQASGGPGGEAALLLCLAGCPLRRVESESEDDDETDDVHWSGTPSTSRLGPPLLGATWRAWGEVAVEVAAKAAASSSGGRQRRRSTGVGLPPGLDGPCPGAVGPHWLLLGFQGPDPATDVRSCGLLALVHLAGAPGRLGGAETARTLRLSDAEPPLGRGPRLGFPLAAVSINATRWALDALRRGALNREADRRGGVAEATARLHAGCVLLVADAWARGIDGRPCEARDLGSIVGAVRDGVAGSPRDALRRARGCEATAATDRQT